MRTSKRHDELTRSEAAAVFKKTPQAIEQWQHYFNVGSVVRYRGKQKLVCFNLRQFEKLIFIDHLTRIEGFTFWGAKRKLELMKN